MSAGDYVTEDGMFCITGDGSDRLHGWNLWEGEEAHGTAWDHSTVLPMRASASPVFACGTKCACAKQTLAERARSKLVTDENAQRRSGIIVTVAWDDGDRARIP